MKVYIVTKWVWGQGGDDSSEILGVYTSSIEATAVSGALHDSHDLGEVVSVEEHDLVRDASPRCPLCGSWGVS